ncbi:Beta-mannosyltransferase 2 [Meyerozyma sp. JA9]|nr:Beta-mannosyltransferase 2 [Meyerozyma sp. JA9]
MLQFNRRLVLLIAILGLSGLLVVISSTKSDSAYSLHDIVQHAQDHLRPTDSATDSNIISGNSVIFPTSFHNPDLQQFYFSHFPAAAAKNKNAQFLIGAPSSSIFPKVPELEMKPHVVNVFLAGDGQKDLADDMKPAKCESFRKELAVEVSKPISKNVPIEALVKRLLKDPAPYMKEFLPFFEEDVKKQFAENTIKDHWYRLAGSSVWLESHRVHFMISRLVYSKGGARNAPNFSMVLAQVFDENWQEINGAELVVPTNNPDIGNESESPSEQRYRVMKFPSLLPIPAYLNVHHQDSRYYGPEDSRILLVRNPAGYEEPLIVFNAYHRKIIESQAEKEDEMNLKFGFYRSMFAAWPWQQQRGKQNMEDVADKEFDKQLYTRAVELRRENMPRIETQKNWTPFVSSTDRAKYGYDKYAYFLYRYSNMEVLRCDLTEIPAKYSSCKFVYRMDDKLSDSASVGAMRGGTTLYNINELLQRHSKSPAVGSVLSQIPRDREIWMGFARAHIKDCGCGKDMYRPNFVVVTRDGSDKYQISHISSFASLNVPVAGWDINNPEKVCQEGQPSVFIPNGISSWTITSDHNQAGFSDDLTLAFSIADVSVEIVHIRNVLSSFVSLDSRNSNLVGPAFGTSTLPPAGFDNFNIECALEGSKKMCAEFGKEHETGAEKSET